MTLLCFFTAELWSLTNFYVSLKLLQAKSRFLCDINGRILPKERYERPLHKFNKIEKDVS